MTYNILIPSIVTSGDNTVAYCLQCLSM